MRELDRRGLPAQHLDGDRRDRWLDEVEHEALSWLASPQLALL